MVCSQIMNLKIILLTLSLFSLISCGKNEEIKDNDILLRYGEKELKYSDVVAQIPDGVTYGDSMLLFNTIVDAWINDVVLSEFAEERLLDISTINRRVSEYRNALIVQEYLTRMRETQTPKIEEQKIKEYYETNRKDLKLEQPLIKGVFLKVNAESSGQESIKKYLTSSDPNAIDKLEQDWFDRALEYNYFRDKWIDWKTLSSMMPYRFGDAEIFLRENDFLEIRHGDCNYYLQISEYLPVGEEQPYEFARIWISDLLTQTELKQYQSDLVESIIKKAIKENKLELTGYDPLSHKLINNKEERDAEK